MHIQFKQGVIEFCILNLLKTESLTGYRIEKGLTDRFRIPEGSIYPLLRKMTQEGYLVTRYVDEQGKQKKYFNITDKGLIEQDRLHKQWVSLTDRVNGLIKED